MEERAMNKSILRGLTWEDVQEIWFTTDQVLRSIPEEPERWPEWAFNTSTRFGQALRVLRGENGVPPPIEERYPGALACAEIACGQALTDSRERENTLIRQFVAYRLHNEGYSFSEIGKMLKRDHSTIAHHCYRMRDMLSVPGAYKWEVQQFKRFEELLK